MKRVIRFYLSTFLVLDTIMGLLLKYLHLQEALIINPGQIVRGILLLLLVVVLIKDALKQLDHKKSRILLLMLYFCLFVVVVFFKRNPDGLWAAELNNMSKLIFMLLLVYYINKHKFYFLSHLDKIMFINFCVLTANLLIGYFTNIGLATYAGTTSATKGLFYSGNAVSVLSIVFFAWYFFKLKNDPKAKYFCVIAVIDIYIVGTKAIFMVPFVFLTYLLTRIRWTTYKVIAGGAFVIPLLIAGIFIVSPFVTHIFQSRYVGTLRKTGINVGETSSNSSDLGEAVLAYRRVAFAIDQVHHQFSDVDGLIFGYGNSGQKHFWQMKGFRYTFSAMDFIDFLFEYGIIGSLLFYSFIFYPMYLIIKRWEFTPLTVSFIFIFLYSFFGGYVIFNSTANTMFALLIALNLPQSSSITKNWQANYAHSQPISV